MNYQSVLLCVVLNDLVQFGVYSDLLRFFGVEHIFLSYIYMNVYKCIYCVK